MSWSRHRIPSGDAFRSVTRLGVRSARSHVVAHLALLPGAPEGPRVGFVVSKKVGNSVVRHRVTRRLREIVRPRLDLLPPGSTCVLRTLPGVAEVAFADLEGEVDGALRAAARKLATRTADASGSDASGTVGDRS
ncbi:ribonuclease P protein component [Brachybacterium huguangmaarense]